MFIYNLIEYSDAYWKISGGIQQCYRDEPGLNANKNATDSPADNNNSNSLNLKQQITEQTGNGGTKDVEILVPLKYPSNFWRTHEIPLISCEISLQMTCSKKSILVTGTATNQVPKCRITNTKLYVPMFLL